MAGTLTLLDSSHGFADGDINTDGYVAVIPAYQKIYYSDGRNYDDKGYHKLDFVNTKITTNSVTSGPDSIGFTRGEPVNQASGPAGFYDENTDVKLGGSQAGVFVLGEKVTQATTLAIGFVVNVAAGQLTVCPVSRNESTGEFIDFETGDTVTGETSGAATTVTSVSLAGEGLYHFIYRTTTTEFAVGEAIVGGISGATMTPTAVTAPPHWLTWRPTASWVSPDGTESTQNPGIMPDGGSNIGCLCFGRVFLNSMQNPHQWFCSRIADPLDWDASRTDVGAATTSQNAKAGEVGSPIIAMVAYKDHYLVFGCANEVWILRSDPLQGGVNTAVSKSTGFFSPTSWCWDDKNNLYFVGIDGIYVLTSDAIINAQPPVNLTKDNVPKLVSSMGLNRRTDRVEMAYDKDRYGVEISVTQKDGSWATTFWFDLRTGGLFPDKFPADQSPASIYYYDSYKSSERGMLMGGYDGYIRKFDEAEKDDEGSNAIDSFVNVGPFTSKSSPRMKVETNETSLTVGENTDGITIDIHTGDSADNLITDVIAGEAPLATKTLTGDGLLNSIRDRISGKAVAIKLQNSNASETWSMEDINMVVQKSGRKKV
jgi:hypothetical protein